MKRDWLIITLPTVIAVILLVAAMPLRDAVSQELDRRPCVSQNSPEGCVPLTRGPVQRGGNAPNPDAPGVVPVTDWPVAKPNNMPPDWQVAPDYLPKEGTVTVEPAPKDEQPTPE